MNLSVRSLHANHELLVISEEPHLCQTFEQRWQELLQEVEHGYAAHTLPSVPEG